MLKLLFFFTDFLVIHDHLKSSAYFPLIFGLNYVDNFAQKVDFLTATFTFNILHQSIQKI